MTKHNQESSLEQGDQDGAAMAAPVKTIVYAQLLGSTIEFVIIPDDDSSADKFHDGHIHFAGGSGGHDIHFRLVDGTRKGLKFADDPIWVEENVDCPTKPGINSTQIPTPQKAQGRVLIIRDLNNNSGQLKLGYQLNFVDRNGNPVPFDPIIINDGGQFI